MNLQKDFELFAKSKGISSLSLSNEEKRISNFINPSIIEERDMGQRITEMNVFSRLLVDRILFLSGEVNTTSMDVLTAQLLYLDSVDNKPISLYINSGGGDCYSGLELVSTMNFVNSPISTIILGMAASMGAVISSSGEKGMRFALPYSRFMVHQPSSNFGYSRFTDSEIALEEMKSVKKDLYEILAKNCGKTVEEIEQMCNNGDKWLRSTDAVSLGFVDKIIEKKQN